MSLCFKIITFGCKLNQAESEKISADLILNGFRLSVKNQKPNIIIINACAVTHKAVREGRQKVANLKRKYSDIKIVVTGCIEDFSWNGVDLWIKNNDKNRIADIIKKEIGKLPDGNQDWKLKIMDSGLKIRNYKLEKDSRNRALIKIQTGCNNFCSYCIVPFLRGKSISLPPEEIVSEILKKEKEKFKEIILTGINIGLYHLIVERDKMRKHKKVDLVDLLKIILINTKIQRIRLGSFWPTHINSKLIDLISKNPRLCPHLHLSIQSGSDRILKLMNRNYTKNDILEIVEQARRKIPKINFTCDLIVGFPSETDKDFQNTCELVKKIGFSKVHIFKYSKRPKTKAALMLNQVDEKIKQKRSKILLELGDKTGIKIKKNFIGQKFEVLWEGKRNGYWEGFTENYIRIRKKGKDGKILRNEIKEIKMKLSNIV